MGSQNENQNGSIAIREEDPHFTSMQLIRRGAVNKRKYQEAIYEACKEVNSLVVLPTGLGKTVIAAMIAAHRLLVYPTSKVLFLAPTKPLVKQHKQTLLKIIDVDYEEMSLLTGEEKPARRQSLWRKGRVVFATPQVIASDLLRRRYDLRSVSLVIFDEAHRAIGNYSYVRIAKEYFKQSEIALTLGLTASPGWSQDEIAEIKQNLSVEHIEAKTEASLDVAQFIHPLEVQWVRVQLGPELTLAGHLLDEMMDERLNALLGYGLINDEDLRMRSRRAMVDLQKRLADQTRRGPGSTPMAVYQGMTLTAQVIRLSYAHELLNTQGLYALRNYIDRLVSESESPRASNALKELTGDVRFAVFLDTVKSLMERGIKHPKLIELIRILKEEITRKGDSRILVFAQFRDTVKQIVDELRSQGIVASPFIGQRRGGGFMGMTQIKQVKALRDFKEGLYSALVATSVAEEGLGIAECDLVVLYDAVASEVRYIQRRGRVSRHNEGKVVSLITVGTQDERYYLSAISKEKKMRDAISRIKEKKTMRIEDFVFGTSDKRAEDKEPDAITHEKNEDKERKRDTRNGFYKEFVVANLKFVEPARTIIVNRNIEDTNLTKILKERGLNLIIRSTRGADYIVGDNVGIICVGRNAATVTEGDYAKLCQKIDLLIETFAIPILLYEKGCRDQIEPVNNGVDSLLTMAAYFTIAKRIHFLVLDDEDEISRMIDSIAKIPVP